MVGLDGHPKYAGIKDEVSYKKDAFRSDYKFGQYVYHNFVLGDNDKIIVGYQITSWWNDGTNGWFKMHRGNVLESEIKVETSSYKTRGCDWQVEAWMVSKLVYEKQEKNS